MAAALNVLAATQGKALAVAAHWQVKRLGWHEQPPEAGVPLHEHRAPQDEWRGHAQQEVGSGDGGRQQRWPHGELLYSPVVLRLAVHPEWAWTVRTQLTLMVTATCAKIYPTTVASPTWKMPTSLGCPRTWVPPSVARERMVAECSLALFGGDHSPPQQLLWGGGQPRLHDPVSPQPTRRRQDVHTL